MTPWAIAMLASSTRATETTSAASVSWLPRPTSRRRQDAAALAVYALAWIVLVGRHAVVDPAHTCACLGSGDPTAYMWSFVWWPHAILHGLNPFFAHNIWAPVGANVAAADLVPGASILFAPVTAAFGPLVTYNLLSFLAPVLAGWFAFLLCRRISGAFLPSLVGGYIFGFSTYELGQMLGHLNLTFVFLVPAAVHLVLRRLDQSLSRRAFMLLFAGLLAAQFLLSAGVLVAMLLFGAITLALGYVVSPSARKRDIRAVARDVVISGCAAAVLVSPFLYYLIRELTPNPSVNWFDVTKVFSADPLNYIIPTPVTGIAHGWFVSLAAEFNMRNYSESGAYIGLPLLVIVVWFFVTNWHRDYAKVLLGILTVIVVASLGPYLHIANPPQPDVTYRPAIPLPWLPATRIPGLDRLSPVRMTVFVFLVVALIVALWLAQPSRRSWPRWLLALAGVALLLPNPATSFWRGRPVDPKFFTTAAYRHYLVPGEMALIFPYGNQGDSMLWQAETHMYFVMPEGYIAQETPVPFWNEPVVRNFLGYAQGSLASADVPAATRSFLVRHRVGAVIVGPGAGLGWVAVLSQLGLDFRRVDGVLFYRVPGSWIQARATAPRSLARLPSGHSSA
jgi:hypothetical protein